MTVADDSIIKSFMELGLSEQKAKETLKNAAVTKILQEILHEVRLCFILMLQNNNFYLID